MFELHRRISTVQQNDASVTQYFCHLKRLWDELQLLEGFPECSCGALAKCTCGILKKFLEIDQRNKLIQFLAGLHKQYDQVKTNLLSQDPLPSINKAYHTLLQIEQQYKLNDMSHSIETSAFNVATKSISKPVHPSGILRNLNLMNFVITVRREDIQFRLVLSWLVILSGFINLKEKVSKSLLLMSKCLLLLVFLVLNLWKLENQVVLRLIQPWFLLCIKRI